jgi:hypothetical protein
MSSTAKSSKVFFGPKANATYGEHGSDPHADYDLFIKQARLWLQSLPGTTQYDGWSTKMHMLLFQVEYNKPLAPPHPAPGAKSSVISMYTTLEKKWSIRNASIRQFVDQDILHAMDASIHDSICEIKQGYNLGTTNFDAQTIFDKLETAFGQADDRALKAHLAAFLGAFDPDTHTFKVYLSEKRTSLAFLEKHGEAPSRMEQYDNLKRAVEHLPVFKAPIDNFEMTHTTSAARTFDALAKQLDTYAATNPDTITMAHVINQATIKKPQASNTTPGGGATATLAEEVLAGVAQALAGQTLTTGKAQFLIRAFKRACDGKQDKYPAGSCINHPMSTTHTTEMCKPSRRTSDDK